MKKVIHIPKTNIIRVKKTINSPIPGYPIYLSSEEIFNKEFKNIDIVSENIIKMRESLETDNNFEATKKDVDQNNSGHDLDLPRSKSDDENNYKNRRVDNDLDENEEE